MFPLRDDNPRKTVPVATLALIALNVFVFLYQASLGQRAGERLVYMFGVIPSVLTGSRELAIAVVPPFATLFSSMFLHGGVMHLGGNMLYLWIFGDNIEEAMGRVRYVIFYLLAGLGASLTHVITNPHSDVPAIGASGAISGVLGAYLLLYPRAQVMTLVVLGFFIRLLYIPAGIVLGLWFVVQLLSGGLTAGQPGGGVAFWAHVGGFVAGMLLVGMFKKRQVRFFNPAIYHPSRIEQW
jgi:membrane associated rhomboid family serine protease